MRDISSWDATHLELEKTRTKSVVSIVISWLIKRSIRGIYERTETPFSLHANAFQNPKYSTEHSPKNDGVYAKS